MQVTYGNYWDGKTPPAEHAGTQAQFEKYLIDNNLTWLYSFEDALGNKIIVLEDESLYHIR